MSSAPVSLTPPIERWWKRLNPQQAFVLVAFTLSSSASMVTALAIVLVFTPPERFDRLVALNWGAIMGGAASALLSLIAGIYGIWRRTGVVDPPQSGLPPMPPMSVPPPGGES